MERGRYRRPVRGPRALPGRAPPDCFYADPGLRLAGGGMPTNSGLQPLAGQPLMWFSWHVASWNPARDTLLGYIRFIAERLRRAQ